MRRSSTFNQLSSSSAFEALPETAWNAHLFGVGEAVHHKRFDLDLLDEAFVASVLNPFLFESVVPIASVIRTMMPGPKWLRMKTHQKQAYIWSEWRLTRSKHIIVVVSGSNENSPKASKYKVNVLAANSNSIWSEWKLTKSKHIGSRLDC